MQESSCFFILECLYRVETNFSISELNKFIVLYRRKDINDMLSSMEVVCR